MTTFALVTLVYGFWMGVFYALYLEEYDKDRAFYDSGPLWYRAVWFVFIVFWPVALLVMLAFVLIDMRERA